MLIVTCPNPNNKARTICISFVFVRRQSASAAGGSARETQPGGTRARGEGSAGKGFQRGPRGGEEGGGGQAQARRRRRVPVSFSALLAKYHTASGLFTHEESHNKGRENKCEVDLSRVQPMISSTVWYNSVVLRLTPTDFLPILIFRTLVP